ncbi:MAG: tetratricopeptide repeat protein [Desulfobacteraceae bacterium]
MKPNALFKRLPLLLLLFLLALAGCSAGPPPGKTAGENQVTEDRVSSGASDSPYFNYIKSEQHKKNSEIDKAIVAMDKAVKNDPGSVYLKKELISLYLQNKEKEKALKTAEEIVASHPDNTDGLIILAKLKQMLDHANEARELYQKVLQLDPKNKNIYLVLGSMYLEIDNTDEAFKVYSQMSDHFPDSYAAHFFLGKIHALKRNPKYAEKAFLKTLELKPDLIEPRFELIKIYKSRETKESELNPGIITLYQEILDIDEHNAQAALELPLYYHTHGRTEKAAEMFSSLGRKKADEYDFLIFTAKEFIGKGRYHDAAVIFTGMLKGAPENSTLNYLAGMAFDSLKQSKKAIRYFLKVTPDSKHYKKVVIHTAFLYSELGRLDRAIAFLETKHKSMPGDIDIITYLGSFYEENGAYDKGIDILKKGIALSRDNTSLRFRLGIIQDKAGKKEASMETMEKIIEMEPDNASALNYLGYTYADLGIKLDKAETLITRALKIKPDDGFITDSLGWVYYKKGLYGKAVKTLLKAAELTSFDPVISEHLGDAYEKNGNFHKALEIYQKALSASKEENKALEEKILKLKTRVMEEEQGQDVKE